MTASIGIEQVRQPDPVRLGDQAEKRRAPSNKKARPSVTTHRLCSSSRYSTLLTQTPAWVLVGQLYRIGPDRFAGDDGHRLVRHEAGDGRICDQFFKTRHAYPLPFAPFSY